MAAMVSRRATIEGTRDGVPAEILPDYHRFYQGKEAALSAQQKTVNQHPDVIAGDPRREGDGHVDARRDSRRGA